MVTKNRRITLYIPPETERRLYDLRKTEGFCRMTISEIMRRAFLAGAEQLEREEAQGKTEE